MAGHVPAWQAENVNQDCGNLGILRKRHHLCLACFPMQRLLTKTALGVTLILLQVGSSHELNS
jgi:hypothetical protein